MLYNYLYLDLNQFVKTDLDRYNQKVHKEGGSSLKRIEVLDNLPKVILHPMLLNGQLTHPICELK